MCIRDSDRAACRAAAIAARTHCDIDTADVDANPIGVLRSVCLTSTNQKQSSEREPSVHELMMARTAGFRSTNWSSESGAEKMLGWRGIYGPCATTLFQVLVPFRSPFEEPQESVHPGRTIPIPRASATGASNRGNYSCLLYTSPSPRD